MYREILKDLKPYQPGRSIEDIKKQYNLTDVVKLASNENPYSCDKKVQELFDNNMDVGVYPDNNCTNLRETLKDMLNIDNSNIIFGNGSTEIISICSRAILSPGDEIITCTPTFPIYVTEAVIANAKCVQIPLKNHKFDLDGILNQINSKTKMIYISNPNNPTGTIISKEEQINFLEKVPKDIVVVLDEAYYEYVCNSEYPDSISMLEKYKNIIILRTFSKVYGLASLRIGYGIANPEVITNLEKVRNPFNITTISMQVAEASLKNKEFVELSVKKNKEVLEYMYKELKRLNIEYIESDANFIMINVKRDGFIVFEELLKKGFIVRPGFAGMENYIRVSIGTKEQMEKFTLALEEVI